MIAKIKKSLKKSEFIVKWYDRIKYRIGFIRERMVFTYDKLKDLFSPKLKINKILFIRTAGLGDIIRLQVIVDKVREKYKEAKICYFTSKPMVPLLKSYPAIDKIYTEEELDSLLKDEFDLVINTQHIEKPDSLVEVIQKVKAKKIRGNRFTPEKGYDRRLYWRTWMEKWAKISQVPYNLQDSEKVYINLSDEMIRESQSLFHRVGIQENKKYIGINLGGPDIYEKRWYRNFSVKFLKDLIQFLTPEYPIILTGKSSDRKEEEQKELFQIPIEFPELIFGVDKLRLEELMLIIKRCSCYISTDTGPLHLALAVKTPLIALFGQTDGSAFISPKKSGKNYIIITSSRKCIPCENRIKEECVSIKRSLCMEELPLEEIKKAVDYFLQ